MQSTGHIAQASARAAHAPVRRTYVKRRALRLLATVHRKQDIYLARTAALVTASLLALAAAGQLPGAGA